MSLHYRYVPPAAGVDYVHEVLVDVEDPQADQDVLVLWTGSPASTTAAPVPTPCTNAPPTSIEGSDAHQCVRAFATPPIAHRHSVSPVDHGEGCQPRVPSQPRTSPAPSRWPRPLPRPPSHARDA